MICIRFGIISLLFYALIGCNTIKKLSAADEYRQSNNYDRVLSLPKEMQVLNINDNYPVPKIAQANVNARSIDVLMLPPGSKLAK